MLCKACGFPAHGLDRCEVAARKRAMAKVVHEPKCEFSVVHGAETVVHAEVAGSSRHGKYADAEARKKYRREWMARDRAAKVQAKGGV